MPTVILCHGFPGNDGDMFGLGERLTGVGFNVLVCNHRGSWGSEGLFKDANSLEDVVSAVRYVKSSFVVKEFNVDPSRIALVGYSYGDGMARALLRLQLKLMFLCSQNQPWVALIIPVRLTFFKIIQLSFHS